MSNYIIEEELGRGAWGIVKKVRVNNEIFALKIPLIGKQDTKVSGFYNIREADILTRCRDCPFVCHLVELIRVTPELESALFTNEDEEKEENEEEPLIVDKFALLLEYCEMELSKYLLEISENTTENLIKKKSIITQLLLALDFFKNRGIYHNDLKMNNILIIKTETGPLVKICDFGLSSFFPVRGNCTPNYRAPEVCIGSSSYTNASDIWSIGCIFFEIFADRHFIDKDILNSFEKDNLENNIIFVQQHIDKLKIKDESEIKKLFTESRIPYLKGKLSPSTSSEDDVIVSSASENKETPIDVLKSCLAFSPSKRSTPKLILSSSYFDEYREDINELLTLNTSEKKRERIHIISNLPPKIKKIYDETAVNDWKDVALIAADCYSRYLNLTNKKFKKRDYFKMMYIAHKYYQVLSGTHEWNVLSTDEWDQDFEDDVIKVLECRIYF